MRLIGLVFALGLTLAPLAGEAQPAGAVPRIGLLDLASLDARASLWEAFRQGMRELGYVEGRTVIFEPRSADGQRERLPARTAELVQLKVDVIVAAGYSPLEAARQATATSRSSRPAAVGPLRALRGASPGRAGTSPGTR